jgi:hypothetical protein
LTCGALITVRHVVAFDPIQDASFSCPDCQEKISYTFYFIPEPLTINYIERENCKRSYKTIGKIVNVNTITGVPKNRLNDSLYMPGMEFLEEGVFDTFDGQHATKIISMQKLEKDWGITKTLISLYVKNKNHVFIKQFQKHFGKNIQEGHIESTILAFLESHIKAASTNQTIKEHFSTIRTKAFQILKSSPNESRRLKDYLKGYYRLKMRGYLDFIQHHMKAMEALSPIRYRNLLNMNQSKPDLDLKVFPEIQNLYGICFEMLTSGIQIYAFLNNISNGRRFDQFQHISLQEYLASSKAKRGNCFADTPDFSVVLKYIKPDIRNAIHHSRFRIDEDSKCIILSSDISSSQQEITLEDYATLCCDSSEYFLNLIALELSIISS